MRQQPLVLRLFVLFGLVSLGCFGGFGCAPMARMVPSSRHFMTRTHAEPSVRAPVSLSAPLQIPGTRYGQLTDASPTLQVEEADIVRVQGSLVLYLHSHRGLLLLDLRNPSVPKQLSVFSFYGKPVEMFVQGKTVYIMANDVQVKVKHRGRTYFRAKRNAQLVSVDISNPEEPRMLDSIEVPGRLREGVARKIGNFIYLISSGNRTITRYIRNFYRANPSHIALHSLNLYSFSVANPRHIRQMHHRYLWEDARFSGAYRRHYYSGYRNNSFQLKGFVLSATPNVLMVSKHFASPVSDRWSRWKWNEDPRSFTQVELIDLRDPVGAMPTLSQFVLPGIVGDQFKQTFRFVGEKGVYMGITQSYRWKRKGRRSSLLPSNILHVAEIKDGRQAIIRAQVPFGKPLESVRGSLFDHDRNLVYAITAKVKSPTVIIDPLYVIDIAKPFAPKVVSQIDGLSGDINLFRFLQGREYLMAVGRDNSGDCTGFGESMGKNRVSVSLIDVRNPKSARLIQRRCVSFRGLKRISSMVNQDLDQAHKMVGMLEEGDVHMVSVPVFFRRPVTYSGRTVQQEQSAIGLMRWDLREYRPNVPETQQTVLTNLGTILHPHGRVIRTLLTNIRGVRQEQVGTIVESNKSASRSKVTREEFQDYRLILNFSREQLSVVDLRQFSVPRMISTLNLSAQPNSTEIASSGSSR